MTLQNKIYEYKTNLIKHIFLIFVYLFYLQVPIEHEAKVKAFINMLVSYDYVNCKARAILPWEDPANP